MTFTPPDVDDPPTSDPIPDWRNYARRLDIDDHEIYVFEESQTISDVQSKHYTPAVFGDVDPNPDDPDPDVWPLDDLDPGAPADVDDLVLTTMALPVPYVAWVTPEYARELYGYSPFRVKLKACELPPWKRPENPRPDETVIAGLGSPSMDLTEQRKKVLDRHARFYNGEEIRGNHIIADKWPGFGTVFGDFDDEELRRLFVDDRTNAEIIESFRDHEWFQEDTSIFLRPQYVNRKKVWYCPTLAAKTLVNGRSDITSYRGDPRESIRHRIIVGLVALMCAAQGFEVTTYEPVGEYNVDVVGRTDNGNVRFVEVITGHSNWELHRATYRKLADLDEIGRPQAAFDTRGTAYSVMNHWLNQGLAELPHGTFESDPNIDEGRNQIQDAYDGASDWHLDDWITTNRLWQVTLGDDGPDISREFVTSLDW